MRINPAAVLEIDRCDLSYSVHLEFSACAHAHPSNLGATHLLRAAPERYARARSGLDLSLTAPHCMVLLPCITLKSLSAGSAQSPRVQAWSPQLLLSRRL